MSDGAADTRRHAAQGNVVSQKRLSGCAQGLTDGLQAPAVMSRCALERQGLGSLPLFYFPQHKIPELLLLRHACSSDSRRALGGANGWRPLSGSLNERRKSW